jgi:hypothetical protein
MLDKLANLQHEIWSHWMRYLFEISSQNEDGTVTIPADKVERWKRQMNTKYPELSNDEQESDLEQARKVIAVISQSSDDIEN